MARIFEGTDAAWDGMILAYRHSGVFLQSSAWARVQVARGNVCVRIVDASGAPSLWVALSVMRGLWVWYCPKGPILLPNSDEWQSIVAVLQEKKHASLIRIEPPHASHTDLISLKFSRRRDISPAHTLITHIDKNEDDLFASFHEKTRYNIRVAAKHGVVVKKITGAELKSCEREILSLYQETGNRHGIAAAPTEDLRALFAAGDVWAAFFENKIIATSLHTGCGSMMTYVHGASDYEHRSLMAPYALHWAVMREAHARGFELYDWWGAAPVGDSAHKLAGVTRFKVGFGGDFVSAPGTFEAGIDRVRFRLYTALRRLLRRS